MTDYTIKVNITGNTAELVMMHKKTGITISSKYSHDQSELIALIRAYCDARKTMEPIVKGLISFTENQVDMFDEAIQSNRRTRRH